MSILFQPHEYILMHDTAQSLNITLEKSYKIFNSTSFISYNKEINFDELDGNNKVENCLYRYKSMAHNTSTIFTKMNKIIF